MRINFWTSRQIFQFGFKGTTSHSVFFLFPSQYAHGRYFELEKFKQPSKNILIKKPRKKSDVISYPWVKSMNFSEGETLTWFPFTHFQFYALLGSFSFLVLPTVHRLVSPNLGGLFRGSFLGGGGGGDKITPTPLSKTR